jgi:Bacterial Ig domain/Putative peptidoglycan binding domain
VDIRASANRGILYVVILSAVMLPSFASAETTVPTFSQNYQLWDEGADILALQQWLNANGFTVAQSGAGSPGQETETFGDHTYQALLLFQTAHGLPATGFFGPLTRAAINSQESSSGGSSIGAGSVGSNATTSIATGPTTPATTSPYIPGVTPLPGYAPGELIFGGGSSAPVPDTTPPSVSLTAPLATSTVSGSSVTLSATAADNVAVANVQFKVDGTNIGGASTSSPYTATWNSTGVADGSHTIAAVAEDTSGNYATSSVSVTVDNLVPISAGSADLYWVGGSGNWSDAHHWAITSGGTGQYDPPTAANVVHFDASSSVSSYTVTVDTNANSATTTVANPASGSPTFAGSATWTNAGGLTLESGMGWTYTGAMTFDAITTGKTITTAGVILNNNITFNGTGGGWTDRDNLSDGANDTITLMAGAWNTGGHTITTGFISLTGTTARTATFTSSTFDLTNNITDATSTANVVWNAGTVTNLTSTLTGSTLNFQGYNQGMTPGTLVYPNVNFTGGGANAIGSGTFGNLSMTVPNAGPLPFDNTYSIGTWTVTGTLTLSGYSQVDRLGIIGGNGGRTLTAANVSLTNVDFETLTGAGAATWAGTSIGDLGGNSNITFTSPVTRYWVGGTGNWSDQADHWASTSGGSSGATLPLPQDSAIFDADSFTAPGQVLTLDYQFYPATNFTGVADSPTIYFYVGGNFLGNLTLDPSMQTLGDAAYSIYGFNYINGTTTLTTNGVALPIGLSVGNLGNSTTLKLGSDLTLTTANGTPGSLTVIAGTFNANGHNVTLASNFTSTGTKTRAVTMGSGTWQIGATSGNAWNVASTGMTLTSTGSTIRIDSSAPSGTRTFVGAGLTYNNFEWGAEGAPATLAITGADTFNDFKVDADTAARTLTLPASSTTTVTTNELNGSSGNLLTLDSSTPGTRATISQASGIVADTYLSIQDCAATGGATFNNTNSTNGGNNSGWNFQ